MQDDPNRRQDAPKSMSVEALAALGDGQLAYVRELRGEEATALFPNVPSLAPDLKLWALLSANGKPIVLADTPQAVMQNAFENKLVTVSLH